jgi:putative lipoprotein
MNKTGIFIVAIWLGSLSGCSEQTQHGEASEVVAAIDGQVSYRERILLPAEAELQISLEDVSRMDVAATLITSSKQSLTGAPPYAFSLEYPEASIEPRMRYSLRAKIMLGEKLLFTSTEQLNPFGAPEEDIVIMLTKVSATEEQQQSTQSQEVETGMAVVSVNALAELTNTYWKLLSLNEVEVTMSAEQTREAFLQLRADDNSVKGFAGCNAFAGGYTVKGNELSIGPLAVSRKFCSAGMETESEFVGVLESTAHFSIHGETLILLNDKKRPIGRFAAMYFK